MSLYELRFKKNSERHLPQLSHPFHSFSFPPWLSQPLGCSHAAIRADDYHRLDYVTPLLWFCIQLAPRQQLL